MAIAVFTSLEQLCDNAGDPLNGGSVTVYEDTTTTLISLFSAANLTGAVGNPITLDAYGRHAMTYFAAQAYKVLVKDSGGSTIFTRDVIDPGVPIGTGVLDIANGGTGAATAPTALANLGAATAAELSDLATEVAAITGALASTEKSHVATGTTAQRPASPANGDIRRNTTDSVWEGYNGAAWENLVIVPTGVTDYSATDTQEGLIELATQAEMETATDVVRAVTPGLAQYHPGMAKAWAKVATDGTIAASYNITSVVKDSTGDWTVTIATDFGSANYAVICTLFESNTGGNAGIVMTVRTQAAGSFTLQAVGSLSTTDVDPTDGFFFACFGDQ